MSNELITNDFEQLAKDYLKTSNLYLNENELKQFIMLAKGYGLNPFKKEVYAIKFGNQFQIVVAYPIILAQATKHADYAGCEIQYFSGNQEVFFYNQQTPDLWSKTTVYKYVDGKRLKAGTTQLFYSDYSQQRKNSFATNYFHSWCEKLAMVNAIRRTYPADTQGLYISDEFTKDEQPQPKISPIDKETLKEAMDMLSELATADEQKQVIKSYMDEAKHTLKDWKMGNIDLAILKQEINNFKQAKLEAYGLGGK